MYLFIDSPPHGNKSITIILRYYYLGQKKFTVSANIKIIFYKKSKKIMLY